MITMADFTRTKQIVTKDLVNDQTATLMAVRSNSAGVVFDANGYGTGASATSTVVMVAGFSQSGDMKMVATMKAVSPTTTANEDLGVFARMGSFEAAGVQNYYYARLSAGVAKLSKVVAGSFSNLATQAWNPAIGTSITITLQCVGTTISAIFHDNSLGLSDYTPSQTDSAVPALGFMGFRSLTSTIACASWTATEL